MEAFLTFSIYYFRSWTSVWEMFVASLERRDVIAASISY
jgi:hypothetical protein